MGSVNTIVRRADNTLYGDNTDVAGFEEMVHFSGLSLSGEKVLADYIKVFEMVKEKRSESGI